MEYNQRLEVYEMNREDVFVVKSFFDSDIFMPNYKYLIFDVDDTLLDFHSINSILVILSYKYWTAFAFFVIITSVKLFYRFAIFSLSSFAIDAECSDYAITPLSKIENVLSSQLISASAP